ncbi:hypothetical protein MJH12_07380, partial [bacterium]|nr:hypothetical protein [bacterium]
DVTNLRSNLLANGTSPWTVSKASDQLTTSDVSNLRANTLANGTSPWTSSEASLGAATSGLVLAGDRTWKALNPALVGLNQVQDVNVLNSFTQNLSQFIATSKIEANSSAGLLLQGQSGPGLIITSDGLFGINISTPEAMFHVNGDAKFNTLTADDLNSQQAYFESTSFAPLIVNTSPGDSGVALFVAPSGNVGIRTTAPIFDFEINGVLNVNGDILQYGSPFSSGGSSDGAQHLVTSGANDTFVSTGNFGVGIANPIERLDVNGGIKLAYTANENAGTIRFNAGAFEGFDGASWLSLDDSDSLSSAGGALDDYILLVDSKPSGMNGGTNPASVWTTRELQTVVLDDNNIVQLIGNQFTLPSGTYKIRIDAPAYAVQQHKIRLVDSMTQMIIATGTSEKANHQNRSFISTQLTLVSSATFEVQHFATNSVVSTGFGLATNQGEEIYTRVEIIKENGGSGAGSGVTNLVDSGPDTNLENGLLGLNVANPTELLDIDGKVRMRTTSDTTGFDGTIRWTGTDLEVKQAGTWESLTSGGSSTESGDDYILIIDQKVSGSNAGSALATTWNTRELQTIVSDSANLVQVTSNQFTLPAGTYRINARAPAYKVNNHKLQLYNVTDAQVEEMGSNAFTASGDTVVSISFLSARVTLALSTTFELRHYTSALKANNGLGVAVSNGVEIYTSLEIIKENGGSGGGSGASNLVDSGP